MKCMYNQIKVTMNQLMTWTHHLYFPKKIAVVVATLIQMTIKIIQKALQKSMTFVFWSTLIILFRKCFTCLDKSIKITRKVCGSLLIIMMTCSNGHKNIRRSQPSINNQSLSNILICQATLFSANTFQRIYDFFYDFFTVYWKDQVLPTSEAIFDWCSEPCQEVFWAYRFLEVKDWIV